MKRLISFTSFFILVFLASCASEPGLFPEAGRNMASVSVLTRSDADAVSYMLPVHVYAFTSGGKCAGYQMLAEAGDSLSFTLPAGEYTLYALAGVSAGRYALPAAENASPTSPVALIDPATGHAEIETGRADVTLDGGKHEKLTLTVTRAVAQVKMSVSGLPDNLTAVKMSLQPLETLLRLDGSFDEAQAKRAVFSLARKEKGVWHLADSAFVFPSKQGVSNVTIGIALTDAGGEQSYSSSATFRIEANCKYKLEAVYRAGSLDLRGVITGTDWAEERQYTFDFGEGSGSGEDTGEEGDSGEEGGEGGEYAPGDFYRDLYILDAEQAAGETVLTLLAATQWDLQKIGDAHALLSQYSVNGISGWTYLSEKEARLINGLAGEDLDRLNSLLEQHRSSAFTDTYRYLCTDKDGTLATFSLQGPFETEMPQNVRYSLRAMKKLKPAD
jgi:hypothetical protein